MPEHDLAKQAELLAQRTVRNEKQEWTYPLYIVVVIGSLIALLIAWVTYGDYSRTIRSEDRKGREEGTSWIQNSNQEHVSTGCLRRYGWNHCTTDRSSSSKVEPEFLTN